MCQYIIHNFHCMATKDALPPHVVLILTHSIHTAYLNTLLPNHFPSSHAVDSPQPNQHMVLTFFANMGPPYHNHHLCCHSTLLSSTFLTHSLTIEEIWTPSWNDHCSLDCQVPMINQSIILTWSRSLNKIPWILYCWIKDYGVVWFSSVIGCSPHQSS